MEAAIERGLKIFGFSDHAPQFFPGDYYSTMRMFPEELADKATSLFLEGGRTYDKDWMTAEFLNRLETAYDRFLEIGDLSFIKNSYEAFLINRGEQVRILDGRSSEEWTGAALGINEYGELLIQHKDGSIEEVSSGEVSVRGLYSYV